MSKTMRNSNYEKLPDGEWTEHKPGTVFRCPVHLLAEPDGGYSVIAATLPGVASQGDNEQDALANVREAFAAVISVYREGGGSVPWLAEHRASPSGNAKLRWVVVHV